MNTTILIEHLCREAIGHGRFDPRFPTSLAAVLSYFTPRPADPADAYEGEEGFGEDPSGISVPYYDIISALANEPDFVPALRRGIEMLDAAPPSIDGSYD
jgi:hypothetical protein